MASRHCVYSILAHKNLTFKEKPPDTFWAGGLHEFGKSVPGHLTPAGVLALGKHDGDTLPAAAQDDLARAERHRVAEELGRRDALLRWESGVAKRLPRLILLPLAYLVGHQLFPLLRLVSGHPCADLLQSEARYHLLLDDDRPACALLLDLTDTQDPLRGAWFQKSAFLDSFEGLVNLGLCGGDLGL